MKFFSLNAWYVPLPVTFGAKGAAGPANPRRRGGYRLWRISRIVAWTACSVLRPMTRWPIWRTA